MNKTLCIFLDVFSLRLCSSHDHKAITCTDSRLVSAHGNVFVARIRCHCHWNPVRANNTQCTHTNAPLSPASHRLSPIHMRVVRAKMENCFGTQEHRIRWVSSETHRHWLVVLLAPSRVRAWSFALFRYTCTSHRQTCVCNAMLSKKVPFKHTHNWKWRAHGVHA